MIASPRHPATPLRLYDAGDEPWISQLLDIVALSLRVSITAGLLAALIGLPLGAAIAVGRFPGRRALIILLNAMMGLPPSDSAAPWMKSICPPMPE